MALKLKGLTRSEKNLAERLIWADFKGVKFQVRYLSKATLQNLLQECQIVGYVGKGEKTGRTGGIDFQKLSSLLAKTLIHNWNNATPNALANLYEIDLDQIPAEQRDEEIEFNEDNLTEVLLRTHDLDNWLQDVATDPANFRKRGMDEQLKNSQSSQITT